jgi:hypothetical protein
VVGAARVLVENGHGHLFEDAEGSFHGIPWVPSPLYFRTLIEARVSRERSCFFEQSDCALSHPPNCYQF